MAQKKVVGAGLSREELRTWIEPDHHTLSITRQCEQFGLARSSRYSEPCGDSVENLMLMRRIDELYTQWPFYGSRKLALELGVNRKRVGVALPRAMPCSSLIGRRLALACGR